MTGLLLALDRLPHLPALVAGSVAREITEWRLRPGDRLPTEQALSATFDVSRTMVRTDLGDRQQPAAQPSSAFFGSAPTT